MQARADVTAFYEKRSRSHPGKICTVPGSTDCESFCSLAIGDLGDLALPVAGEPDQHETSKLVVTGRGLARLRSA
jgi:hypothetical protein